MTKFQLPSQDGEPVVHFIHATIDGTDRLSARVRTFWAWESTSAHLVQIKAQIAAQGRVQGITVSTLRQWVKDEQLGYAVVTLDGIDVVVPVDHLISMLRRIEWFNNEGSMR